jgi:hypothetical protein
MDWEVVDMAQTYRNTPNRRGGLIIGLIVAAIVIAAIVYFVAYGGSDGGTSGGGDAGGYAFVAIGTETLRNLARRFRR